MNPEDQISAIAGLSGYISNRPDELKSAIIKTWTENKWLTQDNYLMALDAMSDLYFDKNNLRLWINKYPIIKKKKNIGLILAGNIPLVGMHDFLSVYLSGHNAIIKCSNKDAHVLPHLVNVLITYDDRISNCVKIVDKLDNYDAIIATGSDSSKRQFESYFKNYPKILRGHRNSIAILNGSESSDELKSLGVDIFSYYGLGCRNVSKILVPRNYDFNLLKDNWSGFNRIADNYKYKNNYDYNSAYFILNVEPCIDFGFILLKENNSLHSRLATLHFEYYSDSSELNDILTRDKDKIQCVVGITPLENTKYIPFGQSQYPSLEDYADDIDTMDFLTREL